MFDPTKPTNNAPNSSAEMRAQLNGLKDLIDAVQTITDAVIDSVSDVNPGDPAMVNVSVSGGVLHFSFQIPRGQNGQDGMNGANGSDGQPGPQGNDGGQGPPGNDGAQGPPFATAIVDGVTMLDPWQQATVDSTFDGSNVHFTFGIPRGNDGSNGTDGGQGPPGEVTNTDLASAINGTSNNTNSVSNLGQSADGEYNQSQMQAVLDKLDELINALRR